MTNLVPLPYSRIAVQHVETDLDEAAIRTFLHDKEAWFETDYVIFRRGGDCAVVKIEKTTPTNSFCRITSVDVLSQPDCTRWIDDAAVDTGNPSALAEKARASGIGVSETLVVNGLYEHVNFIHHPEPLVIEVFDLSPPEPSRLLDMARRVLAHRDFPAIVVNAHIQSIPALARDVVAKPLLFPAGSPNSSARPPPSTLTGARTGGIGCWSAARAASRSIAIFMGTIVRASSYARSISSTRGAVLR